MFSNASHCRFGAARNWTRAYLLELLVGRIRGHHSGTHPAGPVLVDDPLDLAGADQVAEPAFGYLHHVGGLGVADLLVSERELLAERSEVRSAAGAEDHMRQARASSSALQALPYASNPFHGFSQRCGDGQAECGEDGDSARPEEDADHPVDELVRRVVAVRHAVALLAQDVHADAHQRDHADHQAQRLPQPRAVDTGPGIQEAGTGSGRKSLGEDHVCFMQHWVVPFVLGSCTIVSRHGPWRGAWRLRPRTSREYAAG